MGSHKVAEVVALEGGIFASDRAFDDANRYDAAAEISLLAHGNIGLSVTADPMVVVTTQGIGFNDATGGTNKLQSTAGSIFIGTGAQVMANFTGGNGTNGTNLLTACGGVFNSGTVNPADTNPADDSGVCLVPLPTPLFPDCQSVESRVSCAC